MSNELPHASLQCSDCGTTFRVTLKKGRVPSKPIPCPKCKHPVTVTEADIVRPGTKTAKSLLGKGELRQTKPGDVLRKTKLVKVDDAHIAELMDPPTAEVPLDPPTAEVDPGTDGEAAPAFGIIQRKKIRPGRQTSEESLGLTVGTPGVHVVKGEGRGRRDNVFGDRTSNSMAIGRISTKQVQALPGPSLNPEDPDLPAAASEVEEVAAEASPPPNRSVKKLDLSRLRRAMERLDAESEAEEHVAAPASQPSSESEHEDDDFHNPLDDFDLALDEIASEASSAMDSEAGLGNYSSTPELAEESSDAISLPEAEEDLGDEPSSEVEELDPDDFGDGEVEPSQGTLSVAPSEAYELGEAAVPVRIPEPPASRGRGGVVFGLVMLVFFCALAYWVLL